MKTFDFDKSKVVIFWDGGSIYCLPRVFFFLEPRRRAARHFIKVEKNKGLDRPHPAPMKVPLTTNYIHTTRYDGNNPTTSGLGQGRQRPRHQLM